MDFIALYTLHDVDLKLLTFSYDIVCQWSRNLKDRVQQLPSIMQPPNRVMDSTRFVIPKMHIYGHGKSCQTKYSLNYLRHSARMDGEDPERWWAHINPVTASTREMGPGSRQDTIDDHAAAWNFRKIIGFGQSFFCDRLLYPNPFACKGSSLLTQLQNAIKMRAKHEALFSKFSERFSQDQLRQWTRDIELWEEDPNSTSPYDEPDACEPLAVSPRWPVILI
jgi:Kyakuja-Dileera-Zisupton transposase